MQEADKTASHPSAPPPVDRGVSLFLDLDGTLVDLIDRPDNVTTDTELRALLLAARERLDGRLAIVSGRSLAQLDRILGPVAPHLALAGSHGAEFRHQGRIDAPDRPRALDAVARTMGAFADRHEGVLLEVKSFGVGLHYRMAQQEGEAARALARALGQEHGLFVQEGHDMVELRPTGHDKGFAIRHLMAAEPFADAPPVFVGDDLTDEAGFAMASALGGYGVLVGKARPSAALFRLAGPSMVRNWLKELSI